MFDFSNITHRNQLRKLSFDDVAEWCEANNKVDWLVRYIDEYTTFDDNGENPHFDWYGFKEEFITMMGFKFEAKEKKLSVLEKAAKYRAMLDAKNNTPEAKADAKIAEIFGKK